MPPHFGSQGIVQIGAMDEVVTLAVELLQPCAAIDPYERTSVLVVTDALVFRVIGLLCQRLMQAEMIERMCRRRTQ